MAETPGTKIALHKCDWISVLFLAVWPFLYFWQITIGQRVWFTDDIMRQYYPFGVEFARALSQGHLPLWITDLQAGFPLLAEGQVGALYPINLIFYKVLPAHFALSYELLLHLSWAGCGMYALVRSRGIGVTGALFAGFVFSFNGVIFGQLMHAPIIFTIAWLPWLIFLLAKFQTADITSRAAVWFGLTAIALGAQFLSGSAHIAFLNSLAFGVFGVFGRLIWHRAVIASSPPTYKSHAVDLLPRARDLLFHSPLLSTLLLLALGASIAAIQLIPTAELVGFSVRAGGLDEQSAQGNSLPPSYLAQFILPFAPGEPSEADIEYRGYIGMAPLILAYAALVLRADRQTIFFAAFALGALSLALGGSNPLYGWILNLPLFNYFRDPARYLHLFVFAATFLGAIAVDSIANRASGTALSQRVVVASENKVGFVVATFAVLTGAAIVLVYTQPLVFWLNAWQVLPGMLFICVAILLVFAMRRCVAPRACGIMAVGLTIFDLTCYSAPFLWTTDSVTPAVDVTVLPRSVQYLGEALSQGRVYTPDSVYPSAAGIRNSLYPNTALVYGKATANIYTPLVFGKAKAYMSNASPEMMDLMNVHFSMVSLEPRLPGESSAPIGSLSSIIASQEIVIPPTSAASFQVASYTEQADDLTDGTAVGEILIRFEDGSRATYPMRIGFETSDWDDERKAGSHNRPPIAHSFPAYWRPFGHSFQGHTYLAQFNLNSPSRVVGISMRTLQAETYLVVENVLFSDAAAYSTSLASLAHYNNFGLAYMSDVVAAWENLDVMPNAFVVHSAQLMNDDAAFAKLRDSSFRADRDLILSDGQPLRQANNLPHDSVQVTSYNPESVRISVSADSPGYLVLTDAWYPGWDAFVDGQATPILRADVLFRAVYIEPGSHTVVFDYHPWSFAGGAIVTFLSLAVTGLVVVVASIATRRGNP